MSGTLIATSSPVCLFFPRLTTEKPVQQINNTAGLGRPVPVSRGKGRRTTDAEDLADLIALQKLLHSCCTGQLRCQTLYNKADSSRQQAWSRSCRAEPERPSNVPFLHSTR